MASSWLLPILAEDLQVLGGRPPQQLAAGAEAGTVQGAVPGFFGVVPAQDPAQMRAHRRDLARDAVDGGDRHGPQSLAADHPMALGGRTRLGTARPGAPAAPAAGFDPEPVPGDEGRD